MPRDLNAGSRRYCVAARRRVPRQVRIPTPSNMLYIDGSTKAILRYAPSHVAAPCQIELVVARDARFRAAAERPRRGGRAPDGGLHGTPFPRARTRFVLDGTPHPRDLGRDCGAMARRYGCCLRP